MGRVCDRLGAASRLDAGAATRLGSVTALARRTRVVGLGRSGAGALAEGRPRASRSARRRPSATVMTESDAVLEVRTSRQAGVRPGRRARAGGEVLPPARPRHAALGGARLALPRVLGAEAPTVSAPPAPKTRVRRARPRRLGPRPRGPAAAVVRVGRPEPRVARDNGQPPGTARLLSAKARLVGARGPRAGGPAPRAGRTDPGVGERSPRAGRESPQAGKHGGSVARWRPCSSFPRC